MTTNDLLEKIKKDPLAIKAINLSLYEDDVFPKEILLCKNVTKLVIDGYHIKELPTFLEQLPLLSHLSFTVSNNIKFPDNLSNYPSLKKLEAYCNSDKDVLKCTELHQLESLTICGENVQQLPHSISNLTNLKELVLFQTSVTELPQEIKELNNLKQVSINKFLNNKIKTINCTQLFDALSKCKGLKSVNFNNNAIEEIPKNITQLSEIVSLSLESNNLTQIPNELYRLTNLTEIDLGQNQLLNIPKGIGALKKLKVLKLNSNWKNKLDATNLMNEIHLLENLQTLHLWSCQSIKEIPEAISDCKKLKEIDLDNNLLEDLPNSIYNMKWLKKLRVITNNLNPTTKEKLVNELAATKVLVDKI